eukprot:CAMPEP_0170454674 /NCGR_PEP_ID=MMETSP0123-20130129/2845_1 /TAXON_ID=182087 /ORGANISM="Favella ehrenbergii, Strain Fehren 1" /LENGTH=36 /DNA_ID= /DNA_START= /DNA_END= /DNA_ORIENTATION=
MRSDEANLRKKASSQMHMVAQIDQDSANSSSRQEGD